MSNDSEYSSIETDIRNPSIMEQGLDMKREKSTKKVFISQIKSILEKERNDIIARARNNANIELDVDGDDIDLIQGRIIALATSQLLARDRQKLVSIENTFKKIVEGEYGKCVDCEELIGEKRLLANPAATLCISCAEGIELANKKNGR